MPNRIIVPLIVACALFMENMDATVITTALPAIANDIGVDPISLKLALTAYLLSLAVFIPISGWMADRFGARTIFRAAIIVFTLGSAACGFAQGLNRPRALPHRSGPRRRDDGAGRPSRDPARRAET